MVVVEERRPVQIYRHGVLEHAREILAFFFIETEPLTECLDDLLDPPDVLLGLGEAYSL
jgi:hypothetical protein